MKDKWLWIIGGLAVLYWAYTTGAINGANNTANNPQQPVGVSGTW